MANPFPFPFPLPLCEFEDSQNCLWFAPIQGNSSNGQGNSFIDIMGTPLYAEQLVFIAVMVFMAASIAVIIFDRN